MSRAGGAQALFWLALAFAVTMALLPHPPATPLDRLGDKAEHMLAFATLALLATQAFPRAPLFRIAERLSFAGALIEVLQAIPALHRDCDIRDWIADTLAITAVLTVAALGRRAATRRDLDAP
ncbi:hypothetical protein [uncultured Sphingomonas sp.]|uniref:hypothetical protein n=1 Tax=uncultured Sphingomonas sp. TaxID=158754 RepID=UPI0035CA1A2E